MSKKKLVLIVLALVCIILAVSYIVNYYNVPKNTESQPQNNPSDLPEGPQLVVPEGPIGIFGLISALAAGFGMFAIIKKRK